MKRQADKAAPGQLTAESVSFAIIENYFII